MTRLDIINAMIGSTGANLLTAEQTRHPHFMKANQLLKEVIETVQSKGLWFNTETREIQPTSDGELLVPLGCIQADPVDRHCNLTLRGRKMFNLATGTFEVSEPVCLKMTFNRELEDMPLLVQSYIRAYAKFEFYLDRDGAEPRLSNYRNDRDTGWAFVWREHLKNRQTNIHDNPSNTINQLRRGQRGTRRLRGGY